MIQKPSIVVVAACAVLAILSTSFVYGGGQREKLKEKVTVQFWMPGQEPTIRETMESIVASYTASNPQVQINYIQAPWDEWFTKLATAIAGNTVPEIAGAGWGQFGMLATQGVFAEIPDSPGYALDDIQDWVLEAGTYQDKLYGLVLPETRPLAYRNDHFKEAGLDPRKPPTNWDELLEYAKRLTKRENDKVVRGGIDIPLVGWGEQVFLTFYAQNKQGANLWDSSGKPLFHDQQGIETLRYLVDFKLKHNLLVPSEQQAISGTAFEAGLASMGFPKSQGLPALIQSQPGVLGFANPTKKADAKAFVGGTFLSVYKNARHREEAFDFQAYLYSAKNLWSIYKGILFLPTRKSLEEKFAADADYNQVLTNCLNNSVFYNINPKFGEARTALAQEIEQAFYAQKTPEKALKDAHDRLMAIASK